MGQPCDYREQRRLRGMCPPAKESPGLSTAPGSQETDTKQPCYATLIQRQPGLQERMHSCSLRSLGTRAPDNECRTVYVCSASQVLSPPSVLSGLCSPLRFGAWGELVRVYALGQGRPSTTFFMLTVSLLWVLLVSAEMPPPAQVSP